MGPEANVYDIDFTRFRIRDTETSRVLFEVTKANECARAAQVHVTGSRGGENDATGIPGGPEEQGPQFPAASFAYQFPAEFLELKTVGATIEFTVGQKPIQKFRMIERPLLP